MPPKARSGSATPKKVAAKKKVVNGAREPSTEKSSTGLDGEESRVVTRIPSFASKGTNSSVGSPRAKKPAARKKPSIASVSTRAASVGPLAAPSPRSCAIEELLHVPVLQPTPTRAPQAPQELLHVPVLQPTPTRAPQAPQAITPPARFRTPSPSERSGGSSVGGVPSPYLGRTTLLAHPRTRGSFQSEGCSTPVLEKDPSFQAQLAGSGPDPMGEAPLPRMSMERPRDNFFATKSLGLGGNETPSWSNTLKGERLVRWSSTQELDRDRASSSGSEEEECIKLPMNAAVNRLLQQKGSQGLTFLDVAVFVTEQLESKYELHREEFRFLRDCLHAGRHQTQLPCGLRHTRERHLKTVHKSFSDPSGNRWKVPPIRGAMRSLRTKDLGHAVGIVEREPHDFIMRAQKSQMFGVGDRDKVSNDHKHSCPWLGEAVPRFPCQVDPVVAAQLEKVLKTEFHLWSFDIFQFAKASQGRPLQFIGWEAFCRGSLFSEFAIDPNKTSAFLHEVDKLYLTSEATPYHNNLHAADVTQTLHALIVSGNLDKFFDPMDIMVLTLAAVIHDAGHDGRTNSFHINLQDNLALTYNDRSVLENFHLSQGFKLLANKQDTNFLQGLPIEQIKVLRKEVVSVVLATDMAFHFTGVSDFSKIASKCGQKPSAWHEEEHTMERLRATVLHTADLANPTKGLRIATEWSERCLMEFFQQGDEERTLGLPLSPMCDRYTVNIPGSQIGFIDFIVQPSYAALALISPRVEEICGKGLRLTKDMWVKRQEQALEVDKVTSTRSFRREGSATRGG